MNASERFLMNHGDMDSPELVLWLEDAATLQEAHPLLGTKKDEWVPGSIQFRQHRETISKQLELAMAMNVGTTKELAEAHAAAVEDIIINANYIVLRAKHEKNDLWLHNNGFLMKEKTKRNYNKIVSSVALRIRAKNGPGIGEVTLSWDKDSAAGSYQVQMCKGEPQGEESYEDQGYFKKVRAVISNLERASWYYFRVRSIGNNETSPWSDPVGIVIT